MPKVGVGRKLPQPFRHGLRRNAVEEHARGDRVEQLGRADPASADDRQPACHRLEHDHAELLELRGIHEDVERTIEMLGAIGGR
jgi:hypothetical protein